MKIYKYNTDSVKYNHFILLNTQNMEPYAAMNLLRSFDGCSHKENWRPILLGRSDEKIKLPYSDFPLYDLPVVSERAAEILEKRLCGSVEFLPVETEAGITTKYYIMNVLRVIDALDRSKSEFLCFNDGIRIAVIKKYSFFPERVEGVDIFKLSDEALRRPFVSESLVNLIKQSGLQGLDCQLVWEG